MNFLKYLLSILFRFGAKVNRFIRSFTAFYSNLPIISIGNVSFGGSGKSVLTMWLIENLQSKYPLLVLSRGYNRVSKVDVAWESGDAIPPYTAIGDEPVMFCQQLRNGTVVSATNRAAFLKAHQQDYNGYVVLLDDGFQHVRLQRTVELLILDDTQIGKHAILRESLNELSRAHIIMCSSDATEQVARTYASSSCTVYRFEPVTPAVIELEGNITDIQGSQVLLVTGIANPERVTRSLKSLAVDVVHHFNFPDHYPYNQQDVTEILRQRDIFNPPFIVTTSKDAVRLEQYTELHPYLLILQHSIHIQNQDAFLNDILHRISIQS